MAKMRGFKPEIWTDDKFVQLSPLARLLFMGMWNYACDNGHVEDKPIQLKIRLLPADDCDVTTLIDEIVSQGMAKRAKGVITIPKLPLHQRLDKRYFTTCSHCAPDGRTTGARSEPDGHPRDFEKSRMKEGSERKEGSAPEGSSETEDPFATFYDLYPKKIGRGQAAKAHKAAVKKASADDILDGLKAHLPIWEHTERQFIPNPATWLNGERWADDVDDETADDSWAHLKTAEQIKAERGY